SLDAAPLVRRVTESAYRAGASYVEALWGDESMQLARFTHAPRESFGEYSAWLPDALLHHAEAGHAVLSIYANDPDLLKDEQMAKLWSAISKLVRLDRPDPVAAWEDHLAALAARRDFLNQRRYGALVYRGPGTDLTLGLATGHTWMAGRSTSARGIVFAPN